MAEKLSTLEREHGLEIPAEDRLEALGAVILRNLSPAKAERLAKDPRVYALSPDQEVRAYGDTIPWGVERIGAPTTTAKGAGVSVYVLDTGIKVGHEDLTNLKGGYAVVKCRGRCAASYDDDNGHGTHVAGTAAAVANGLGVLGVAPQAELWAVKVLSGSGSGSISGIVQGINWVIPFYAESLVLGHQWKRVCRLRVSGSWARTRHRSATTSIVSSRS